MHDPQPPYGDLRLSSSRRAVGRLGVAGLALGLLSLAMLAAGCGPAPSSGQATPAATLGPLAKRTLQLTLVHSNDTWGYLLPCGWSPQVGGVARRATQIAAERAKGGALLVLDAGDSLVGDQDPAVKTQGQSSVELMNRMGYDALVLGPKDLALGSAVLKQRIAEAKFAVLSANAVLSATGELLAKPYVVREFAGHRVAIVGLSGGPATVDIAVRNPLETAKKVTDEAAKEADIVILLSHAGPKLDQQIADTVSGIAMIVSGGPGALQEPRVSTKTGTPIYHADAASSGHAGRMLGVAVLEFTPQGELTSQTWQSVSLGPEIADDPAMAAWVQEQMKR